MESKNFLVDSSVLVAFFREKDCFHSQALAWIESQKRFAVTDYVLLEVSTVLQMKEGHAAAEKALRFLIFNKHIGVLKLTEDELAQTIALFIKQKDGISFVDASLLILTKQRDLTLATFDKGIIKTGSRLAQKPRLAQKTSNALKH